MLISLKPFHKYLALCRLGIYGMIDFQGPTFVHEPPSFVDFSNATGKWIDCTARGSPPPVVKWALADGTAIVNIPGLRQVFSNGTLHFHPFRAEDYHPDVHAVTYKCFASNPSGVIVSRDVKIRAGNVENYCHIARSFLNAFSILKFILKMLRSYPVGL